MGREGRGQREGMSEKYCVWWKREGKREGVKEK